MRTMMRATIAAAFLAALALATGCEDTPLTAGKDFKMTVVASPSTVDFPPGDTNDVDVEIFATIVSDTSVPQAGLTVLFTTSSNASPLESQGQGRETDGTGIARDTLHVQSDAPASITVTASSGALTKTVTVTKTVTGVCDANSAPTAVIAPSTIPAFPAGATGTTHATPTLLGTASHDDESGWSYLWDCGGGTSPSLTDDQVICTYTYGAAATQHTITLVVTDDGLDGHPECALPSAPATVQVDVPAGT